MNMVNMESGNEAAQFDFWEYIIRISFTVQKNNVSTTV
jgi:hypothetical protein